MKKLDLGIMGGCGSSGTTLLIHLLSRHPDIVSGPEFNLFNHYELYDIDYLKKNQSKIVDGKCDPSGYIDTGAFMTYREHYGLDEEKIRDWINEANTLEDFIYSVCLHMRNKFSAAYFLEKSPTNIYCFKHIASNFPEIPLIHVIRDGRDVVSSLMKRGFNLYAAGSRWLYDTLCGIALRGTKNYMEVRYETLVTQPDETLTTIYRHLGFEPYINQGEHAENNEASIYNEDWTARDTPKIWNQTPSDPISTDSIGKYKKSLCFQEMQLLNKIKINNKYVQPDLAHISSFSSLLEHLGYVNNGDDYHELDQQRGAPNKIGLQLSDYTRRLSRFNNRYNYRKLPKLYTGIS